MIHFKLMTMWAALAMASTASAMQPLGCLIEPDRVAEIGSPVIGVIQQMLVERGDTVKKDQVIAVLRADVERAALDVARSKAQAEADLQAATTAMQFARRQHLRAEDLFKQNFISDQALEQTRTEARMAEQKLEQAREQQRIWGREVGLANAQLGQRSIRSPIDGVIADRYVSAGERVETKPLVRVAKIDPLRVEVVVPAALYGKVKPASVVSVAPDLPDVGKFKATVVLVDKVIDAASNTFRVRLELPNPNGALPAGLRCRADLGIDSVAESAPAKVVTPAAATSVKGAANAAPLAIRTAQQTAR
jgi:RND family efflux transporter MFP subunit